MVMIERLSKPKLQDIESFEMSKTGLKDHKSAMAELLKQKLGARSKGPNRKVKKKF